MGAPQIVILSAAEAVAAIFIIRLWTKRRKLGILAKFLWSAILLVPVLGVVAYGFCATEPDEHPYDTDTTSGSAEVLANGGEHDSV
jgi:hypothetical protein